MEKKYKLFTTPTCPNCPAVKEFLREVEMEGEEINAANPDGAQEAAKFGIMSVPTVIFFNNSNEVVATARNLPEIKRIVDQ